MFRNSILTLSFAAALAACSGASDVELEETDASETLGQELNLPRDIDTTRLYFGEPRVVTVGDENPYFYGLFELVKDARMVVQLHDTAEVPGAVGFKFYRVKPNGKMVLFAVVDGSAGAAAIGFRTTVGGSYVVEAVGEGSPAVLEIELRCRSGRCAPTQQIGDTCAGIAALRCDEGLRCEFAPNTCRMPDAGGTCALPAAAPMHCAPPNPAVDNRVCGCDGNTYWDGCHARAAGVSIAASGPCEPQLSQQDERCGGAEQLECAEGLVCRYAEYTCTEPGAEGTCQPPATGLHCGPPNPAVDNRICGCDGVTYWDRCHARIAGASIAADGPCEPQLSQQGERCGGAERLECAEGLVCSYAEYTCTEPGAEGTCQPAATGLQCGPPNPAVDNRICGCDGVTYWDRCHARIAGASIAADGPCAP